jgi:serine/threonine-protein kinase
VGHGLQQLGRKGHINLRSRQVSSIAVCCSFGRYSVVESSEIMALAAGTKLGPYAILAPIGAGGMGEVYRAHDTQLDRDVAIKVLPSALAQDPERLARFEREAKVLATLNHPNIAQIYGVEQGALVMELVEGETLSGPVPLATALHYARQISEALEYAHERGVIHRDLKPANIKVTPEETVKLLDFGLAKAVEDPAISSDDPSNSPTLTLGATRLGVILGTAAYMSPEQARGKEADRRSDIWSFGAVLFEMLSGKRAFAGDSVSDTLASVLKLEPDWNALPGEAPWAICRLVRRCLKKDRKQRLQAIGDARIAIEEALSGTPQEGEAPRVRRQPWPWIAFSTLLALSAGVAAGWFLKPIPKQTMVQLVADLGADVSLSAPANGRIDVAISPDGRRLAYVASVSGGPPRLLTRRLDQPKATELPGTDGASGPFFSPDGQWIGFVSSNKLNKISVEGGAVVALADIGNFAGASWGEDGNIIVAQATKGLIRVPSGGGASSTVTELANGEVVHGFPQVLPGGKAVVFAPFRLGNAVDYASIDVFSFGDRHRKTLVRGGTSGRYVSSGHLMYSNKGTVFAIAFDPRRLETHGTAVPILDGIAFAPGGGAGQYDVSRTGTLVYRREGGAGGAEMMTLQWLDSAGRKEPLRAKPGIYADPRLSADGNRLAFMLSEGPNQDVWVYDEQREGMTRLTFGRETYRLPVWSPDGKYVVFTSPGIGMFWTRADGAGQPQPLTQSKSVQLPSSFSPDGRRLAFMEVNAAGFQQIWTMPVEDNGGQLRAGKPESFLQDGFNDTRAVFSPDGRWLAYQSNESGGSEVNVRPFPPPASGQGGKWPLSNSGGQTPVWSQNGRDLFYRSGDQIMAVSYTVKGDSFLADKPRVWFAKLGGTAFDISADGKRVALLTPANAPEVPKLEHEIVVLFNFFEELRRRVSEGK